MAAPLTPRVCLIGAAPAAMVAELTIAGEPPLVLDRAEALGTLATEAVAAAPADRDVVLVHGPATLPAGDWLSAVQAAAQEPLAGAAVALTAEDLPARRLDLDAPPRPRVPASASPVILLTRPALALVSGPDPAQEDWATMVTDLVQQVVLAGLVVVAAGDVLAPADGRPRSGHPWLEPLAAEAQRSAAPEVRARARARRAVRGLSVTLDCRSLGPVRMGTQTHALGLALALADLDGIQLRCLVAHDLHPDVAGLLRDAPGASLLTYEEALQRPEPTAVVHRPQQVNTTDDLALLQPLGERLVVTHLDLIGYRNPGYHADVDAWLRHRHDTRYALDVADRVLFLSEHARADALAEDLVDPAWTDVVGLGVDLEPGHGDVGRPSSLPAGLEADSGFLLHLGTDLRHKNRPFTLHLLRAMRAQGWDGALVVAGPDQAPGGTRALEDALLAADPALAAYVHRLGAVSEAEKAWLLRYAEAVVYPTVDEGFGLLPFEAAVAGTPAAHAGTGALGEVLPGQEPLLVPWDPMRSADRVVALLRDREARAAHVNAVRQAAERYSWRATVERTAAAYEAALRSPRRAVGWQALDRLATEAELQHLRGHTFNLEAEVAGLRAFRDAVGEDGARLVGHHPQLPVEDRRALLAVLARPTLRKPFLALLRAGYRAGRNP